MGVKIGYRKTIRPKNKEAKRTLRKGLKFVPYTDKDGKTRYRQYRERSNVKNN